ncbi:Hsp20/alpha crystallin family protein [Sulfoacidibacillus thermotolerans]|uniref:SHSP domain-containing protein n=1 Tax=Sulfoacidibacillus thermotolerans TaxID=1765684 RepID=A0A2U3D9W5_SULT2|nr:Hsp20 family protein [Sulfoacidibacillus thermotolerans]PWI58077.1 hypothetical protein BM613_05265 [Sulfoacidibacillus thermotolerans]
MRKLRDSDGQPSPWQDFLQFPFDPSIKKWLAWLDPKRLDAFFAEFEQQVVVTETKDHYDIIVNLPGVKNPEDITATLQGQVIHLKRQVQRETRVDRDHSTISSFYYHHFERAVHLEKAVRWRDRTITCTSGRWQLRLPKKN